MYESGLRWRLRDMNLGRQGWRDQLRNRWAKGEYDQGRVPLGGGKRLCPECRRARGKQRNRNRARTRQHGPRLLAQCSFLLSINDGLMGIDTLTPQAIDQIAPAVPPMKMKKRRCIQIEQEKAKQRFGVSLGRECLEAELGRDMGGSIPNAEGAAPRSRPLVLQAASGTGAGLGCQDQRGRRVLAEVGIQEPRRQQRAEDRMHSCPEPLHKHLCKAARLRFGARDENGNGTGLRGHASGVTSGGPLAQWQNMTPPLTFLGIESSCDDTAAAVVRVNAGAEVLSSIVVGQTALHAAFGGVVPEIAARAHVEKLDDCVVRALNDAGLTLGQLDGIAVTAGPGLIGGVLSGVMLAKGIAAATGLPLVGVNHLAGHALTPRLTDDLDFPYLLLLVSGGHCQFLVVEGPETFHRLGGTIDDAPGEAFDKAAKMLGLPQPGGPSVEAEAASGEAGRFALPRPLLDRPGCDMSFSGLKTALLRARDQLVTEQGGLLLQDRRDLCAAFQQAVTDVLVEKTRRAMAVYLQSNPERPAFAVAGGVAANMTIRTGLEQLCEAFGVRFTAPPLRLCTDNAAMIAYAGIALFRAGQRDGLDLSARPRWPLDRTAPALIGSGKKGAKA